MASDKPQKKNGQSDATTRPGPRWTESGQPEIAGAALYEWNVVDGTTWYSEEWKNITQTQSYDWTRPNSDNWWTTRVHPDDMAMLVRVCLAMLTGMREKTDLVYRLKREDGEWRWLFSRAQVTEKSPDGTTLIVSGICLDITDLYTELQAPKSSSSISDFDYHAMLENSPDLFIRLDRDLRPLYVNPVITRYVGHQRASALTSTLSNIRIEGEYKKILTRNVERVFRDRAVRRESVRFTLADGREISGECTFWPEFDARNNVQSAMVQFRDLTEKRRMQQRNQLNEQRLEALYRLTCMESASEDEVLNFVMDSVLKLTASASGFIFIPECEGCVFGKMLWSKDHYDFVDKSLLPDNYLPNDLIIQMPNQNPGPTAPCITNNSGGKPLWVVFNGKMAIMRGIIAPGKENNRVVCIAGVCNKKSDYDESDLKQLETFINSAWLILRRRRIVRELQEAKEAAEVANKAKDAFLAKVSHELRTPLNGVLSMLQLIESMPLQDEQKKYLETAHSSGKALLRIISDLLDFSCMESGNMHLASELFDCKAIIRSALSLFQGEAEQKELAYTYHIDPAIPDYLLGDEHRVRQILFNIVGNALKFTARGSIRIRCDYLPDEKPGKAGLRLTVEDTGIGIAQEQLSSIFDAFNQIESRNSKYKGTGLGLSIVKHLASLMDGTVSVRSEAHKGTRLECVLFFTIPSLVHQQPEKAEETPVLAPVRALDILVAEDDAVSSFALKSFLEKFGHRVVCVADGVQALQALQLRPFDCLFTDIAMPNMDGIELVGHIRAGRQYQYPPGGEIRDLVASALPDAAPPGALAADLVIVAVTAHTMIGDKERFLNCGVDFYISKPIIRDELGATLKLVLNRLRLDQAGT